MTSFNFNDSAPVDETPLTFEEVCALVCGLVAYPSVYASAKKLGLQHTLFNLPTETPLATFMALYAGLLEEHGAVTKNMFLTHIRGLISSNMYPMAPATKKFLFGDDDTDSFIDTAFAGAPEDSAQARAERTYIQSVLRRFLNARVVNAELKRLLATESAPLNIDAVLDGYRRRAQAIKFVGQEATNAAIMPAPGGGIILPPVATPTSISWIDNYIGGFRSGDIIGLLGPYAGGKTTMLATVATRMARQYATDGSDRLSVYICYEDGAEKMNWMFYSAAAHIHRDRFKNKSNANEFWGDLSTRETLRPYERELMSNRNGEIILSETERWAAAMPWFNANFVFLDFSASAATNYRGNGGISEIVATLEQLRDSTGKEIGFVAYDYLSLGINRELNNDPTTKHSDQIWRQLQAYPDELKVNVAVPFSATVLLAHQLAQGDIKNIPAHKHVSHSDAQGSKAFGENVHACVCLNKPDVETGVSTIHWSKIRFDRPSTPYGLVKIDHQVVDVWAADEEYYINDISKKIMRRGEAAPVATGAMPYVRAGQGRRMSMQDQPDIDSDFLS